MGACAQVPGRGWLLIVSGLVAGWTAFELLDDWFVLQRPAPGWEDSDKSADIYYSALHGGPRRRFRLWVGLTGMAVAGAWAVPLLFPLPLLALAGAVHAGRKWRAARRDA